MSGNWDDSDSEEVEVVDVKPVIMPRARQPSIAKSLEKAAILENPIAGSIKAVDDSDDDDSLSVGSAADSEDFVDHSGEVVTLDFDAGVNTKKFIALFNCDYRNIVSEFADVEIFLISLDSLLLECLAHKYHNWTLAGQSVVLAAQLDRFLEQFVNLGGKFKLVVFTDLAAQFARDTTLSWARAAALAHIQAGQFAKDLEFFSGLSDPRWEQFLNDLTPSFIMISTDNVTSEVCAQEDVNFTPQLETIVLHSLSMAIPVVYLTGIVVNFASVSAYFIDPKLVVKQNWDSYVAAFWEGNSDALKVAKNPNKDVSSVKTPTQLWANIISSIDKSGASEHFESLCCAVLLSSLVCGRRGVQRVYLEERKDGKRGLDVIRDRRLLINAAAAFLEKIDYKTCKFAVSDIWDGRMILGLFDAITANDAVLPYRCQEEFAAAFTAAGLTKPIPTDTNEKLFEPQPEPADPLADLPILYNVESTLLDKFVPEQKRAGSAHKVDDRAKQDYADWFRENLSWKFKTIEEEFAKPPEKVEDAWQLKRANKARQFMSRWYEMFANSLEGRGSNLLVDFSRTPRGFAVEEKDDEDKKKKGGWAGQKPGKEKSGKTGAKGKAPVLSKKDQILAANAAAKAGKLVDGEKAKIKFATQQGKNAITYLENLMSGLELPETKALCVFETTVRVGKDLAATFNGPDNKEARRNEGVKLIGLIKACFTKHWEHLDEKQKDQIVDLWVSLGFDAPTGRKASSDALAKKLDLSLNMVYYQMVYGGQLIDIQSDPKKDDRVTGFAPDAWQRRMLDIVDKGNSAVIIAPTSAGKTFVSYYCIEKVLRASDDDVVVFVSPSKALTNQVCGSVYARFRNKSMSRGRALFGTLTSDYGLNALNCQVLVTVPECLEQMLLSTNPVVQQFVSRIKHVIFDEVHSIGASEEAHIWEHLLLLIRCPFLALSATIGNASKLHEWLNASELSKSDGKRKVELIQYGERYSELELAIQNIDKPQPVTEMIEGDAAGDSKKAVYGEKKDVLFPFMPYGVYMPEKLRMFGIPDDQQLTARQILDLYRIMADVDEATKAEFEPCAYFGFKQGQAVWLSRGDLRRMENGLKKRFLDWLSNDSTKMNLVLKKLNSPVKEQLSHRAVPFNKTTVAVENIVPLIDEMREKAMLPAICFNDDRHVCEALATRVAEELEERQKEFENSAEFKSKYAIKDEEKLMKLAKRKRDAKEGKKGKGDKDEMDDVRGEDEEVDPLAAQRHKIKEALARFKLRGRRSGDDDIYDKMTERMSKAGRGKESTKLLLRLFERGIGFHHAGLSMAEKGAVEVLFRSGHLAIIFSTSTLALGMNMPCKTVIFGVDTAMLTPLMFRQMSGRAGRRGFDHSGTVVFMSVPTSKIRRLLTASLSTLNGNPPFTTGFLLRLLAYVHQQDVISEDRSGQPVSTVEHRAQTALTLLQNSFSLYTRKEKSVLSTQLRLYTAFSVQLLRHLQLVDDKGAAKGLAGLSVHLQDSHAGNLLFVHLLQKGAFHQLCKTYTGDKLKKKLVVVLANLFTRLRLPPTWQPDDKGSYPADQPCSIFLEALPKEMREMVDVYNKTALDLYARYLAAAGGGQLISPRFGVSGCSAESASLFGEQLVAPMFEGYAHDDFFLPTINLDEADHRGRKVHFNAYVVDFWQFESRKMLETANRLHTSQMWYLLADFNSVLNRISVGLTAVARPQDPVAEAMKELAHEYDLKFRSAFGMKLKFN